MRQNADDLDHVRLRPFGSVREGKSVTGQNWADRADDLLQRRKPAVIRPPVFDDGWEIALHGGKRGIEGRLRRLRDDPFPHRDQTLQLGDVDVWIRRQPFEHQHQVVRWDGLWDSGRNKRRLGHGSSYRRISDTIQSSALADSLETRAPATRSARTKADTFSKATSIVKSPSVLDSGPLRSLRYRCGSRSRLQTLFQVFAIDQQPSSAHRHDPKPIGLLVQQMPHGFQVQRSVLTDKPEFPRNIAR